MKAISLVAIFYFSSLNAQQTSLVFTYDNAGNMVKREIQVLVGARMGHFQTNDSTLLPPLNFKVFPNPANDQLNIEGDLPPSVKEAQLTLFNISGQALKKDLYSGELKTLNVADLKSGMYLLEVKYSKKEKITYKIIVTN